MTQERKRPRPDDYFADWKEREALAEAMIPAVGSLSRERNVKCYIYGRSLVNQSVLDIMKSLIYVPIFFKAIGNSLGPKTKIAIITTDKISNQPI